MARRQKRRRTTRWKLKKQTVYTFFCALLFGGALLIGLSFLQQGTVLDVIHDMVIEYIGWVGIGLPLLLGAFGLFLLQINLPIAQVNVPIGLTLSYICFAALAQSGVVGMVLWNHFAILFSPIGAFFMLLAMFVVGLLVLTNTSLVELRKMVGSLMQSLRLQSVSLSADRKRPILPEKLSLRFPSQEKKTSSHEEEKMRISAKPTPPKETSSTLGTQVITNVSAANIVWEYPPLSLLSSAMKQPADRGDIKKHAQIIEKTLESFGITARVVEVNLGPAVTQYALEIALGTKLSKITALSNDLALALAAPTGQIRIEAPIPGRSLVGIEIPNRSLEYVTLRHMLNADLMKKSKEKLLVSLGLDVSGKPVIANIAKMPHVLIAGTTGSGKSVLINSWISSLLYRTTPAELRLILVDPKRVELTTYNSIPHLLTPVIVDPDKILSALKWATQEMDRRYKLFAEVGVRNIDSYNELSGFQALPYIVIFIDELADLMAFAPVEVEDAICRLAQMARATGVHLVVSTQRPSTDVITGLIKANIPARISFNVSSMVDSRVIIDTPGAEKLLGKGDMLYIPPDQAKPTRIQGTFVSDQEVKSLVEFLKNKNQPVQYTQEVTSIPVAPKKSATTGTIGTADGKDDLFEEAVRVVCQYDRASASLLQRRLSIGYARAARILDQLEEEGVVGSGEGSKPRDVLIRSLEEYNTKGQTPTSMTAS